MKILRALASGVVVGTSGYLLMTSFDILPSPRAMVYGLLFGAFFTWAATLGGEK